MKYLKLTRQINRSVVFVNPDKIIAYEQSNTVGGPVTMVFLDDRSRMDVVETPKEIEKMLER